MTVPPTLESERLILRQFREDDFEPMAAFYASPISSFYGGPLERDDAWRRFAAYPGHWALRGYGPWALEEKSSGSFVGLSGLWYPEGWYAPEITWALVPEHHGKGFATEAAGRALRASYEEFGWSTAVSVIATGNGASVSVAERLGATLEDEIDFRGGRAFLYRHVSPAELSSDD